ncbi:hypothetical protein NEMIN01_0373 [Nematocida minor]|uniref:uncharacterized protein n=1 Tax=Nematocida minor TaxID=1912983 RepID=UPI00221EEC5B|nr:uncharacterized protein NEMIN01_0373 [Nematocida minor]KAI5189207.1 hypothetical protein NEMIN01_0373 [Nematocida minor]
MKYFSSWRGENKENTHALYDKDTPENKREISKNDHKISTDKETDCGCTQDENPCSEEYLAAYKCYLLHSKEIGKCTKEIERMKECQKRNSTVLSRILKFFIK